MSIIPNKYLATGMNLIEQGDSRLMLAQNTRIKNGIIRKRKGQQLIVPQDPFGMTTSLPQQSSYRCYKLFFYNNMLWGYFVNQSDTINDVIAFFSTTTNQWYAKQLPYGNYQYAQSQLGPPQVVESSRRLLIASKRGVYVLPKIENTPTTSLSDLILGIESKQAGCPAALPFRSLITTDTTATYNANWIGPKCSVAYRYVWKYVDANGTQVYGQVSDRFSIINTETVNFRAISIRIGIPSQMLSVVNQVERYSVQIYRTSQTTPSINGISVDPGDEMFFVSQLRASKDDITNEYIDFVDIIPDGALQDPLYTNQTQQGISSSRIKPPIANTIQHFAGCTWFGNIKNRWQLPFQLTSVSDSAAAAGYRNGLKDGDIIAIGEFALQAKSAILIPQNQFQIDNTAGYTNTFTRIKNTVNNIQKLYNSNNERTSFNLNTNSGPNDISGKMVLQQIGNNYAYNQFGSSFKPYIGLYRQNGWPNLFGSDPCPISPIPTISQNRGYGSKVLRLQVTVPGGNVKVTVSGTPDIGANDTINLALPMKKAIAGYPAHSSGTLSFSCNPGQYKVISVVGSVVEINQTSAIAFDYQIGVSPYQTIWTNLGVIHSVIQASTKFQTPAVGQQGNFPARVMYSQPYQPQSAPALNYIDVGFSDKRILKMFSLNKSMLVFKEDGLYRVSGQFPQFSVQQLDPNVVLFGKDMLSYLDGAIFALTTRGVYQITQNGTSRISQQIENQMQAHMFSGQPGASTSSDMTRKYGFAVSDMQQNTVSFWLTPPVGYNDVTYILKNSLSYVYDGQGWTKRNDQSNYACWGRNSNDPTDKGYLYSAKKYSAGWVTRQRKTGGYKDYADEMFQLAPAVFSAGSQGLDVDFSITINDATYGADFKQFFDDNNGLVGAVVARSTFQNQMLKRFVITSSSYINPTSYKLYLTPLDPSASVVAQLGGTGIRIYMPIRSSWKYGISGSQDAQIRKHFTQIGIVFQQPYFTTADVSFSSDINNQQTKLSSNVKGFALSNAFDFDAQPWKIEMPYFSGPLGQKTIKCIVATQHQRCSQLRFRLDHWIALEYFASYGFFYRVNSGGRTIERTSNTDV